MLPFRVMNLHPMYSRGFFLLILMTNLEEACTELENNTSWNKLNLNLFRLETFRQHFAKNTTCTGKSKLNISSEMKWSEWWPVILVSVVHCHYYPAIISASRWSDSWSGRCRAHWFTGQRLQPTDKYRTLDIERSLPLVYIRSCSMWF